MKDPNLTIPSERDMRANAPCQFEEAWKTYNASPLKARQTKKRAREAWSRAISKTDAGTIIAAIAKEVRARENCDGSGRNPATGEFVGSLPDMHRWLREERWNDVAIDAPLFDQASDNRITDMQSHKLNACFAEFSRTGHWGGGRYGWYERPGDPRANYPAELYTKHNLTKPGDAA